ncbi:hypothetical protein [Streptomyces sp. NPDC005141]
MEHDLAVFDKSGVTTDGEPLGTRVLAGRPTRLATVEGMTAYGCASVIPRERPTDERQMLGAMSKLANPYVELCTVTLVGVGR